MQEYGREPNPEEIAEEIHLPVERVRAVLKMAQQPISLQAPVGGGGAITPGDQFFIDDGPTRFTFEFTTLAGPSGSSKTTLLIAIAIVVWNVFDQSAVQDEELTFSEFLRRVPSAPRSACASRFNLRLRLFASTAPDTCRGSDLFQQGGCQQANLLAREAFASRSNLCRSGGKSTLASEIRFCATKRA